MYKSFTSTYDLQTDFRTKILSKKLVFLYKILVQDFVPIRTALRGEERR